MLQLLIVISSLFIGSFGVDVGFSFGSTCFSEGTRLELTAEYNGTGDVTAIQWYYSGQVSNNMLVIASTCDTPGAVPAGYPDKSRMTFDCDLATNIFKLTLSSLQAEELDKSWGATFTLSVGLSPDVEQKQIIVCTTTTTTSSTTSTTTLTTSTTTTPATTRTTPATATKAAPDNSKTTTPSTTTTTPSTTTTTPASTASTMPITTSMRMPITTIMPPTISTTLTSKSTSSTKSSNEGLSDKMIIVIVVVPVGVIAIVVTVIFFCLFYRLRRGERKPTSHERHKQGKHYKGNTRSVQQQHQRPYILYGRGHTGEPTHKKTKKSRSLHIDDRYNLYNGYHWGSRVKQNKGDRNLGRLYYNDSLPRYDDYRSGYTKGHVYPSNTSGYQYRSDYYGDSRRHGNGQHSSYPVYSRQQEYFDPSFSYMEY